MGSKSVNNVQKYLRTNALLLPIHTLTSWLIDNNSTFYSLHLKIDKPKRNQQKSALDKTFVNVNKKVFDI